ncbi:MAG: FAD-dependent oxidoreductase [Nitrospirales bacterium]
MTRHALILGNNLTGLVTAYRLLHYGFHISIADTHQRIQATDHLRGPHETIERITPLLASTPVKGHTIPLVLHGFYHATWSFFQELSFEWPPHTSQSVGLEFYVEGQKPIALPHPSRSSWLHPLTRLPFFKGLSLVDRWHVINFLENQWEEHRLPQHHPDIQSVETWLISAKQSAQSRTHFWNPLCRLFLNCDLPEASLGVFIEVLSRYWFGKPTDAATFLAPPETLGKLETELRQRLINKGVTIHAPDAKISFHTDAEGIQAVEWGDDHLQAHVYVSALAPQTLLALLPERALARNAYFSSLAQIPAVYGLAVQFTLKGTRLCPRLILHEDPFDWIICLPSAPSHSPETIVTCVTLRESMRQNHTEEWIIDSAWSCLQPLFTPSPAQTQESCEPQIIRPVDPFFPCLRGARTHRPLPQTPLPNLFLAGPWTATSLPASLESTIQSANACAAAIATALYGTLD